MNPLDPALEIDWPLEISVISQKVKSPLYKLLT